MPLFGKGREQTLAPDIRELVEAAMRVHQEIGCGFDPGVYNEALAIELAEAQIPFDAGLSFLVIFRGRHLNTACRADFRIPGDILVMVRAVDELNARHALELVTLLKVAGAKQGVLLNFGGLQFDMRHAVAPAQPSA